MTITPSVPGELLAGRRVTDTSNLPVTDLMEQRLNHIQRLARRRREPPPTDVTRMTGRKARRERRRLGDGEPPDAEHRAWLRRRCQALRRMRRHSHQRACERMRGWMHHGHYDAIAFLCRWDVVSGPASGPTPVRARWRPTPDSVGWSRSTTHRRDETACLDGGPPFSSRPGVTTRSIVGWNRLRRNAASWSTGVPRTEPVARAGTAGHGTGVDGPPPASDRERESRGFTRVPMQRLRIAHQPGHQRRAE